MTGSRSTVEGYPEGYPKLYWIGLVLGWLVIGVGLRGLVVNADSQMATDPPGWAALVLKSNLAHDLILLPVVFLVGYMVARVVPDRVRAPIQAGLISTGFVVLYAFPFVRGYGRKADNPSILPQDYGRGLLLVLGFILVVTAAWCVWSWRRNE
ncbi:MAG: hypothetical protein ACRDZW_09780 [Acidimicrobiales bacterium]